MLLLFSFYACTKVDEKYKVIIFEEDFDEAGDWRVIQSSFSRDQTTDEFYVTRDTVQAQPENGQISLSSFELFGEGYSNIARLELDCEGICDQLNDADSVLVELDVNYSGGGRLKSSYVVIQFGSHLVNLIIPYGQNFKLLYKISNEMVVDRVRYPYEHEPTTQFVPYPLEIKSNSSFMLELVPSGFVTEGLDEGLSLDALRVIASYDD